jgi:ankyrin repeat protein
MQANKVSHEKYLLHALENGHVDVLRTLLEQGADINKACIREALQTAKRNNHTEAIDLLELAIRRRTCLHWCELM